MSTSPRPAAVCTVPVDNDRTFQPFPYAPVIAGTSAADPSPREDGTVDSSKVDREAEARAQGRAEGEAAASQHFLAQLTEERSRITAALAQFAHDRTSYLERVEAEVVQLALSIARKVLHREAQVDPLLLAGIVRVALQQIDGATSVVLRVHPQNAADWRVYLNMHSDPAHLPEIIEDPSQAPDQCFLQTSMGITKIGVEIQLKEIEQGLTDLLATRPGVRA